MKTKQAFIYILTNKANTVLYTGVTSHLVKRVWQHKNNIVAGFTQKYNLHKLVYYEKLDSIRKAIEREKQIKAGSRKKKIDLINTINKEWRDLSNEIIQ